MKDQNEEKEADLDVLDILDKIEALADNTPKDRRNKAYKDWKKDINGLMRTYNEYVGRKAFTEIK